MKIAVLGNMNNNGFAIMRYFRDLGADAHLLLYSNDGQNTLSHFVPECDTWSIEKWRPYIHQTQISNSVVSAFDFPVSWVISRRTLVRAWLGRQKGCIAPVTRKRMVKTLAGYDRFISSGIAPAALSRVEIGLDIFYPYSVAVEFLGTGEFATAPKGRGLLANAVHRSVRKRQARGIQGSRHVVNYDMGSTQASLASIGVDSVRLAIPMVYTGERLPVVAPNDVLDKAAQRAQQSGLSILHHARLMWKNPGHYSTVEWTRENKNTDWLIVQFARMVKERPQLNPVLMIVEYGPDVEDAKRLIGEMGIEDNIYWLPKMERRALMWLLARVSVGVGEFYDVPKMIWGGTGWEVLASGKPLLQGFAFAPGEFEEIYGYPPPPMFPVRTRDDILTHLMDMADHPEKCTQLGLDAKEWFDRYNGLGLAGQWLDLVLSGSDDASGEYTSLRAPLHA